MSASENRYPDGNQVICIYGKYIKTSYALFPYTTAPQVNF